MQDRCWSHTCNVHVHLSCTYLHIFTLFSSETRRSRFGVWGWSADLKFFSSRLSSIWRCVLRRHWKQSPRGPLWKLCIVYKSFSNCLSHLTAGPMIQKFTPHHLQSDTCITGRNYNDLHTTASNIEGDNGTSFALSLDAVIMSAKVFFRTKYEKHSVSRGQSVEILTTLWYKRLVKESCVRVVSHNCISCHFYLVNFQLHSQLMLKLW